MEDGKTHSTELSQLSAQPTAAVFVSRRGYLEPGGGGVQWCTREYLETAAAAGIVLHQVLYESPCDLFTRVMRRAFPAPFKGLHDKKLLSEVLRTVDAHAARLVFFNNSDSAILAPAVRAARPELCLVFLSHGVEITDVVNNLRIAPEAVGSAHRSSRWLGQLLQGELQIRSALDAVVCISQEDVAFEQWLGARQVMFMARQVPLDLLPLMPAGGRVGTVATLSHGPNLHGLRLLAQALQGTTELRVVGAPEKVGLELQREFKAVRYLGPLSAQALRQEAATWSAFVNPIFCHARGASTKVATALGWGLPVLTTPHGARGYRWNPASLPLPETPAALAELCEAVAGCADPGGWQMRAREVAALAPGVQECGSQLQDFLVSRLL